MSVKIVLNDDPELVAIIRQALIETKGYCPCAPHRTPDTKCMCKAFREQEGGVCHCGLYKKVVSEEAEG